MKQTDLQRVIASAKATGRDVVVTHTAQGKELHWHEESPRMVYDNAGKHIETRRLNRA